MAKVFVSYSRKDIEFAKKLTGELQKSDLDFWVDWEGIPPTVDWWKQIEKGIEEADVFLFLISPDSASSKICAQEIDCAVKNGKRLIPIVVRDIKGDEAPQQLGHINWIFFRESDDFNAALAKLLTSIQTDYEWAQIHRRLQVKALEWERSNKENSFLLRGKDLQDAELQLATNTSKEPHPTDLQRNFVFKSRQSTDRQRRTVTGISIIGIIVLAALAVFGFAQAGRASKQAQIAVARQLASQAQSSFFTRSSNQMVSDLLSIQSLKLLPNADAASFLINNNLSAPPISSMVNDGQMYSVNFSPDGKYVATAGGVGLIWEAATGREITRLTHGGYVSPIVFSPDGNHVVTGGSDNTVRVWEVATGKEIARMTHEGPVRSVAISWDGRYIASGSEDNTARVWERATGEEISRVPHDQYPTSVAFSPNGQYVLSVGSDSVVRVWEAATGEEIARKMNASVSAFSPDGNRVVSSGYLVSSNISGAFVWEVATGLEVSHPASSNDVVEAVAFSPDGRYVVSGSQDQGIVLVWDAATGEEVARMSHNGRVRSVAFSPDGTYVASGSYDGTARLWEVATGREIARMTDTRGVVEAVAFSPDGNYIAFASATGAFVWEPITQAGNSRMTHGDDVRSIAFSPDGKYVVSGGWDGTARVWEATTGKEISRVMDRYGVLDALAFSPDGNYIAVGGGGIQVAESDTGKEVFTDTINDHRVWSVMFSPDAKYVVAGSDDHTVRVWETATGVKVAEMTHDYTESYDHVYSVAFSPDGKYVISGSADTTARIWEVLTGREVASLPHEFAVLFVAFSPDGKYVVTSDGIPHVWEVSTGREVAQIFHTNVWSAAFSPDGKSVVFGGGEPAIWDPFTGKIAARLSHDDNVHDVAFSPDGKYVVSGSDDNTARVWEAATGRELARMTHDDDVWVVAFSPDGRYVVSGSNDDTARAWMWQTADLIGNACGVMSRNLTRAEWEQYIGDTLPYQAVCENLPIEP